MTVWCVFWGADLLSIHLTEKGAYEELEVQLGKNGYSSIFVEQWEAKA
jgi:hypothetical protein